MNEAEAAMTAKVHALELAHEEQRLATEIAHKERLLAMEFAHESQLSRRNRRIEWVVLGAIVLAVVAALSAGIAW